MLVSIKKQLRDRVWAILEGYAPVAAAVRIGNRTKVQTEAGWLKAAMEAALPADLPQIRIDAPRTLGSGFTQISTLDSEDIAFVDEGGSGTIEWQCELQLTFLEDSRKSDAQNQLADDAQVALLRSGPKLGLAFVKSFGPITGQQTEVPADAAAGSGAGGAGGIGGAAGVKRLRTVLKLPITALFELQWLVAQTNP